MITRVSHTPHPDADTTRRADRSQRITTCRYLRQSTLDRCTAEAADPNGDLVLCTHHLARAAQLLATVAPGLIGALK